MTFRITTRMHDAILHRIKLRGNAEAMRFQKLAKVEETLAGFTDYEMSYDDGIWVQNILSADSAQSIADPTSDTTPTSLFYMWENLVVFFRNEEMKFTELN